MQVNLCEPNPCGLNQKCIDHGTNISCECIPGLDLALCAEMNSVNGFLFPFFFVHITWIDGCNSYHLVAKPHSSSISIFTNAIKKRERHISWSQCQVSWTFRCTNDRVRNQRSECREQSVEYFWLGWNISSNCADVWLFWGGAKFAFVREGNRIAITRDYWLDWLRRLTIRPRLFVQNWRKLDHEKSNWRTALQSQPPLSRRWCSFIYFFFACRQFYPLVPTVRFCTRRDFSNPPTKSKEAGTSPFLWTRDKLRGSSSSNKT